VLALYQFECCVDAVEDRSKLSKRHGATSVDQFRKEGFLPQAMVNYLCLLGWNDSTDQEIYTVDELTAKFSLERVTKSPAVFDIKKLRWLNGQHLRALPEEQRSQLIGEHLVEAGVATDASSDFVKAASLMVAEKVELVNDAADLVRDALRFPLAEGGAALLEEEGVVDVGQALLAAFRAHELPTPGSADFEGEWKKAVKALGKALGRKGKALFMPLRIASTGRKSGPDVAAQLQVAALAEGNSPCEAVSFEERMRQLEDALSMPCE